MTIPNFLVIGVAKAGTTSLYEYLSSHPQVFLSPIKETNFFAFEGTKVNFQGPGDVEKINQSSITDFGDYQRLFATTNGQRAVGEISPLYLYYPMAPERIRHYIPDAKLIAILRNPVDRAYSSFLHLRRDRREPIADFVEALKLEETRIRSNWAPLWHYKALGFYATPLARYFDCFAREQIRIYRYDELVRDAQGLLTDLFAFLGIDATFVPEQPVRRNVSGLPRFRWLHEMSIKDYAIRRTVRSMLPASIQQQGKRLIGKVRNRNLVKPQLESALRAALVPIYRDDILKTEDLIEQDLSPWLEV